MLRKVDIMPINLVVVLVGVLDLLTTLYWVHTQKAIEYNPIMAFLLNTNIFLFIAVKLGSLIAFLFVMEFYRRRVCSASANKVGIATLTAYLGIYVFSFLLVNKNYFLSFI